jgi:hypothetical protein
MKKLGIVLVVMLSLLVSADIFAMSREETEDFCNNFWVELSDKCYWKTSGVRSCIATFSVALIMGEGDAREIW